MNARWADYFITEDFVGFWTERFRQPNANVCVLFGLGFDPRSLISLTRLSEVGSSDRVSYIALRLQIPGADVQPGKALRKLVAENTNALEKLTNATQLAAGEVLLQDLGRYPIGGRSALTFVGGLIDQLRTYQHIIVDISGMPRSVFYPLISFLCKRAEQGIIQNLHVTVVENAVVDSKIQLSEFGDADYIHTFRMEGSKKLVWLPVIGSHERERILKIFEQIKADCLETCPILPFPAAPLRKGDDILVENSDVLYEELGITTGNILLCDEKNPFDIYRKIISLHDYYVEKLSPLVGEVTTVVSPLSSKLLSLGMLFAAIDRHLPVSYVEAGLYNVGEDAFDAAALTTQQPMNVWVTGEPYASGDSSDARA
jgi:hypothetical protein